MPAAGDASAVGLQALLAAAPIVLILLLMLAAQWSAARAGLAALALALVLGYGFFDLGNLDASGSVILPLAGIAAEGGFTALTILWILLPALALHHHQQQSGALDLLQRQLARVAPSRPLQLLLIGWFMALFFEGAAGFGTPVALAAPILVSFGIAPVQAVVLALLGHAVGVSFGALGTPVAAQVALTGLPALEIASRTALLHALLGGLMMLFFVRTLSRGASADGNRGSSTPSAGWSLLACFGFLLPSLALATWLGPELATLGAALIGAGLFVAALRVATPRPAGPAAPGLLRALAPYAVLVLLVLASRAAAALAGSLLPVWQWQWQEHFSGRLQPLSHPGTLLFAAWLIGAALQRSGSANLRESLSQAARRLAPVTIALIAMLCLSRLMLHAGMIDALQRAAVQGLGRAWPLIAPAVGALGSFVTGSATASNVLFSSLQAQTAQALGMPTTLLLAAQGFGAAVGNIVCPHNIVAGAATVGLAGREAEILRRTLLPCLIYLALGGLLVGLLATI